MAEFLVTIDWSGLYKLSDDLRDEIVAQERQIGNQLIKDGTIRNIWELPGEKKNVGIWCSSDAESLNATLQRLPIYPHISLEVRSLVTHPLITDNYAFIIGRTVVSNDENEHT